MIDCCRTRFSDDWLRSTHKRHPAFSTTDIRTRRLLPQLASLWRNNVKLCHDAVRIAQCAMSPDLDYIGQYCEPQFIIERDFFRRHPIGLNGTFYSFIRYTICQLIDRLALESNWTTIEHTVNAFGRIVIDSSKKDNSSDPNAIDVMREHALCITQF